MPEFLNRGNHEFRYSSFSIAKPLVMPGNPGITSSVREILTTRETLLAPLTPRFPNGDERGR